MMRATVIGAGLAGSEAAWQLARRGVGVTLREMKPRKMSPAHSSEYFAELVCSNSLRGAGLENAVGLLKEELRRLEGRALPPDMDYLSIQGLRLEARQKLDKIRPLNLGQASRVSGVSPADVTALMIYLERGSRDGDHNL